MTHPESQEQNEQPQDIVVLRASQAGMRFIAQTHIYNSGNWGRLQQFIADSYHEERLQEQPTESRLQVFKTTQERVGRMKVKQVLAANEHHVLVVTQTEQGEPFFLVEVQVEEDYPHKITFYNHQPLKPMDETE